MLSLPFHVLDALSDYYARAESDAGMRSMHGPMVDRAMSGITGGGTRDPESQVTDLRFGWPEQGGKCRVGQGRAIYRVLRELSGEHQSVLFAAHGPTDWNAIVDHAFGRGTARELRDIVGEHLGVALFTPIVRTGYKQAAKDHAPNPAAVKRLTKAELAQRGKADPWASHGGWLVATFLAERKAWHELPAKDQQAWVRGGKAKNGHTVCVAVGAECRPLLAAAHAAYRDAHAVVRGPKERAFDLVPAAEVAAERKARQKPTAPRERRTAKQARVTAGDLEAWS